MKRATNVCVIYARGLSKDELYEKYKHCCPSGFKPRPYKGGQLVLTFEPNYPEFVECMEVLARYDAEPGLFSIVSHTSKEIREEPFFQVFVPALLELEGSTSNLYPTLERLPTL